MDRIRLEMATLDRVGGAPVVKKMMETRLRWFGE